MAEHTVKAFSEELDGIAQEVARMGGLAETAINDALSAVARRDTELAQIVIQRDPKIDAAQRAVQRRPGLAHRLYCVALQQGQLRRQRRPHERGQGVLEPLPHTAYNYTLRYSEHQPFYEMRNDGSGRPYDNIMEMRTDKIRNFLSVANYKGVADLWVLQYEYLVLKGTQHLIDRIEEWTGIPPRCQAKPPQLRKPKASRVCCPKWPGTFANI